VNVFHANDPKTPHPVILDPSGTDTSSDHNPELMPGDTVQVSRAGLVYVVGDVIRPGGFSVDPVQGITVVQALSLAWGPSQNAATTRAVLIREQKGGRAMMVLNLKRMLRGQDPDQPIQDRDILYVPDSLAKNLRTEALQAAIQSTIGLGIYSALVYSQWLIPSAASSSSSTLSTRTIKPSKPAPLNPAANEQGAGKPPGNP
jgi:polysaccharide export outer membrane protein